MLRKIALISLLSTPAFGQEKTFNFSGITNIDVRNGVIVNVIPGDAISVVATALSGDVAQVDIRKFGQWLAINRNTRWFIFPYGRADEIVVTITLPELRNIKAFDNATASATGFSGDTLRAEALEGGNVVLTDIAVPDVTLYATENATLSVTGTCDTLVVEAIINAAISADDLACTNVAATTRSGGNIIAHANLQASMDDTAGGTITVNGTPEIVDYLPGMEPEDPSTPEG